MSKEDCIFCKIIEGKIPSHKIYEDSEFLAFLDNFPNTKGQTLVIPKKHFSSDVFEMPDKEYQKFFLVIKKVAKLLEKGLNVKRVSIVMEGMGIDHVHAKLYPLHGLKDKFEEYYIQNKLFFDKYPGYITTIMGDKANDQKQKELAEKIKNSKI
jgi:diadenosine tetraphosphate (Ap4A) HIT family hydrolase